MAEEHKEFDPQKKKKDPIRREKDEKRRAEGVGETSSGPSEGKSERSSRVAHAVRGNLQAAGSTLVPQKSECATGAVPKTVTKKKGFFARWKSPKKKRTGGSGTSAGREKEYPDKQQRPATVSKGKFSGIIKNVKKIFVGSNPPESEKVHLTQPEADARPYGEGTSSHVSRETTNPETSWKPMHQDITGQTWENLGGVLTTSEETVFFVNTEMTSLSGSVSVGVEKARSLPSDRMGSFEGSAGDASSLEKEFQDLPSPSKTVQGKKRTKNPLEEEEEESTMESGVSPRKRPTLQGTDRTEK